MDSVFKALADPSRRALLDALRQDDGQTQRALEARLEMSRFGVAKHLKVLEEAGLVTRVRRGREVHHYLNAAAIAEALARWIEPYRVAPALRGVLDLKARLEGPTMDAKPDFVLNTYIRCTQDALWDALTDPQAMARYHFLASRVEHEGDAGSGSYHYYADERRIFTARTLSLDPKTRIEATFELEGGDMPPPSRTVFRIVPEGAACKLVVEHYDLTHEVVPGELTADGWMRWGSALKTYLETGEAERFVPPEWAGMQEAEAPA